MTLSKYIYQYRSRDEERSLCQLEQRSFFNMSTDAANLESSIRVDPSRSPFIRARIDVLFESETVDGLAEKVKGLRIRDSTFKVFFVKNDDEPSFLHSEERTSLARRIGLIIDGEADLDEPELKLALMHVNGRWVFGRYYTNEAVWLRHRKKPQQFSTALSTRLARALVNIAVPDPSGKTVIDPCCGVGTVLIEALSMGIDIVGSDWNWIVVQSARENLAHFGYRCDVTRRAIEEIEERYDVAIIDLPYNICHVTTQENRRTIIFSARSIADRVVFVNTDIPDSVFLEAGFTIVDRCVAPKGSLKRQILVCE